MRTISPAAIAVLVLGACSGADTSRQTAPADLGVDAQALAAFQPVPAVVASEANPITTQKVALGRMLYYDTRFSAGGQVSCYVCHPLHDYGTSHRQTGVGHDGKVGGRNEPTVYNAAGHVAQFWDGRAPDVEAQALGPVLNPIEMGMPDATAVLAVLKSMPGYVDAFAAAFPGQADPVTFENFGRAIGAFERGLVTPSRWDEFLRGNVGALSASEKAGFTTFVEAGCAQCHNGTWVGGSLYTKAGVVNPWFTLADPGRFKVTSLPGDRLVFKVPSLRNIEETWPYFHDGSVQRLPDAVRLMAWHQLGMNLDDADVEAIVAWLRTLTGPVDFDYINEPALPASPTPIARTALR
jgi:cytochrome c peroxidase